MLVLLAAVLAIAILPAGIAYLANRMAIRRGRDIRQFVITLALFEPAWALLLWYWLTRVATHRHRVRTGKLAGQRGFPYRLLHAWG